MTDVLTVSPADPAAQLDAARRGRDRMELADGQQVDVLVVGGGITGVGVALDAITRGLSVALVEERDLASGTSAYSSKLVHGGLRYLAKGDVPVAWESARERSLVAGRIAPHLIRRLAQVVPISSGARSDAYLAGVGFGAGDALRVAAGTPRGLLPRSRRIDRDLALRLLPTLDREGLSGAMVGWDCQLEDDARLVVAVARTAAAHGARILTRTRADQLGGGRAVVTDVPSGSSFEIRYRTAVNATGVWAGALDPTIRLRPSLGVHAVIRSSVLGGARVSLTVPVPEHFGRFVFSLPQADGTTYLGLTDTELSGPVPPTASAPPEDVAWIAAQISRALDRPLAPADIAGSYAGMRPLVLPAEHDESAGTADLSRRHLVARHDDVVTVTGGKLTTYRRMAQEAVNLITETPCRTEDVALIGAGPRPDRPDVPERLWRRYGTEAPLVWDAAPTQRAPVAEGLPVLGVEFVHAVSHELALTPADLVDRRTRVGLIPPDRERALPAAESALA